jgi:hypothetical protein
MRVKYLPKIAGSAEPVNWHSSGGLRFPHAVAKKHAARMETRLKAVGAIFVTPCGLL